jgi:hypothetical protein
MVDLIQCLIDLTVGFQPRAAIRERSRDIHVGIIRASLVSLRRAKVLVNAGVKVTVLEARGRIGGRVSLSFFLELFQTLLFHFGKGSVGKGLLLLGRPESKR